VVVRVRLGYVATITTAFAAVYSPGLGRRARQSEGEVLKHPNPSVRPAGMAPTPAFMQIEGRIARPLPSEATDVNARKFWLVQPWVIVTLCLTIMVALSIPGFLMDLYRGF
jgi:hypothetical protein